MRKVTIKIQLAAVLSIIVVLSFSSVAFASRWRDLPDALAAKYGITAGQVAAISDSSEGQWKPFQPITRAQFVKMADKAYHILMAYRATPSFMDVPQDSPYYVYIEGAKAAGILEDTTATTFSPNAFITREDAFAIMARFFASTSGQDLGSVSTKLEIELASVFAYGIEKGNGKGNLNQFDEPWSIQPLSRIQAAALLIRSLSVFPHAVGDIVLDLVAIIGKGILSGIGSSAGSQGFGWVLSLVGVQNIEQQTIDLLSQISGKLGQLQTQVSALQQQIVYLDYDNLAIGLSAQVSAITKAQQLLASLAKDSTTASPADIENVREHIYNSIGTEIVPHSNQISMAMLGTGLANGGLVQKWSRAVGGHHRFFNKADSDAQVAMYNYWLGLQAVQEELIVEYYHYKNFPQTTVQDEYDSYTTSINNEEALFPRPLPYLSNGRVSVMNLPTGDIMLNEFWFSEMGITSSGTVGSLLASINNPSRTTTGFGFTNWRLPSWTGSLSPEIQSMFVSAPVDRAAFYSWWRSQGWDQTTLPPANAGIDWLGGPDFTKVDFSIWVNHLNSSGQDDYYYYRKLDGSTGYRKCYDTGFMYGCYAMLLPVRNLASGEFYFYH